MASYNHKDIEKKWQKKWEDTHLYKATEDSSKKKCYVLDMFPYPSGDGLHVGHVRVYTASDIYARYKRMTGHSVLHPTGWDAFGLPAEQYALKNKVHPRISTDKNTNTFRRQMKSLGYSIDWDREIDTTDPKFYKWTQWIFKQLYKKGLVSESYDPINWCPSCKTGLANEDLEDGKCERCGSEVEKRPLRQWSIAITQYADRLVDDLDTLDKWPEWLKESQRNWIGRSLGSEITFTIKNTESAFTVFTTRADTLFGCTYCVLAPEHSLVSELMSKNIILNKEEIKSYLEIAKTKTDIDRCAEGKEKTGILLEGVMAINPVNQKEVPVYIADYVLASYGTGAIMAVPAHDERDYEFAKKYNIEILPVVATLLGKELPDAKSVSGSTVIAYDPKKDLWLKLNNLNNNEVWLPSGGINEGETYQECAKRELSEEAGIEHVERMIELGSPILTYYFNPNKNSNRKSFGYNYLAFVDSEQEVKMKNDEHEKYSVEWVAYEDLVKGMKSGIADCEHWVEALLRAKSFLAAGKCLTSSDGILINSLEFDGMKSEEARKKITERVDGKLVSKYKLRDWVFARQRYWGEPFPIVFGEGHVPYLVGDKDLPVELPQVESYEPTDTGESPLAVIPEWKNTLGYLNNESEFISVPAFVAAQLKEGEILDINDDGGLDAYQPKKGIVERNNIACIIKHPTEEKFLISKWKKVTWNGFVTGGIEGDDTEEETAKKEVQEETGYKNIRSVDVKNFSSHGLFHHPVKGENRFAHYKLAVVQLEDLAQDEVGEEEKAICDFVWIDKQDVEATLTRTDMKSLWQYYLHGKVTTLPTRKIQTFTRENNTMPQWAGSSWYWLRFMDAHNDVEVFSKERANYWQEVDMYVGGAEHATRHLIYGRFWHKFLYDLGLVPQKEPFNKLESVGLILGEGGVKMSKRLGNVINPDSVIEKYGADVLRLYEMFIGPFGQATAWDPKSIVGLERFLDRVYLLHTKLSDKDLFEPSLLEQTIKKVGEDVDSFKFNTAISQLMVFLNAAEKGISKKSYITLMTLLAPFAPHATEELWEIMGGGGSVHEVPWPTYNENNLLSDDVTVAIQIAGKMRGTVTVKRDLGDEELMELVKVHEQYQKYVANMTPKKVIIIKNKIVNIVI